VTPTIAQIEGRPLTDAEYRRMHRHGKKGGGLRWTERRNGLPPLKPYVYGASDPAKRPVVPPGEPSEDEPAMTEPVKGAQKVDRFPDRTKYPFDAIARDGGVWKLDPAEYKVQPHTIFQGAKRWARDHGYDVRAEVHHGWAYIQFTASVEAQRRLELLRATGPRAVS
jgi:hypothetical protein